MFTVRFAPPEAVLKKYWRDALQTFKEQICVVAYDEARCISEWYVPIFSFRVTLRYSIHQFFLSRKVINIVHAQLKGSYNMMSTQTDLFILVTV